MATKKSSTPAKAKKSAKPAARRKATSAKKSSRKKAAPASTDSLPPPPGPRHAVFIDVENTNSEQALFDVLGALTIDRTARSTELYAVGNWRAVGQQLARRLGALGAQLVHSAPARGVRDWSDLWIAVAAGCWLGQSRPGDVLEIISNDKAFDAVGDAAAGRGVTYRRLQHRKDVAAAERSEAPKRPRRSRGGRRRRYRGADAPRPLAPAATRPLAPAASRSPASVATRPAAPVATRAPAPVVTKTPAQPAADGHAASRDQMIEVIGRLTDNQVGRWVNLDILEKALKAEGFARPPGSPRLVTRLRALKRDVEIDSHGRVRLVTATATA